MSEPDRPQLYLITPRAFDPEEFAPKLASVLDALPIACLRLAMASEDEDLLIRAADPLREAAHARDVPIVIERHALLVERLGLDGVHLPKGGAGGLRKLRANLGNDAIIGADAGASRHDGLSMAEAGADYVSFSPAGATLLGDGQIAEFELFEWWSQMIEVPVVAEGSLTRQKVEELAGVADFFAIGEEIWREAEPQKALRELVAPLGY